MKKLVQSLFILCALTFVAFAQERTITGTVTSSEDGLPIPGATIRVRGASGITQTTSDGKYSIKVAASATALEFSYLGFTTVTKQLAGAGNTIDAALQTDAQALNEVVITGYGNVTRRSFAGATSNIPAGEVAKQTYGSFDQALQGSAPGISVIANGGQPGQQAVVRIRGNGSINGSNTPLYILDGIEVSAADFQTMNQGDFESIELLKDAVSTGIYGSRGANGVIVINTKKGKAGQIQINYDLQVGRSKMPEDRLIVMNSQQKIDYEVNIRDNPYGWTPQEADEKRAVNFSWKDALFQTGSTQQHQISATGGTEKSKFYASLSYLDQDGIVQTTGLKRYTARATVDNVVNNFRFGLSVQGGFSKRNNTGEASTFVSDPLNAIRWSNPWETARNPDGSFNQTFNANGIGTGRLSSGQPNALMELLLNYNDGRQIKGVATSYLEYHIAQVKGLYVRTNWGVDYTQNEGAAFTSPYTTVSFARNGSLNRTFNRNFRYTGTTSVNYAQNFGKHEVSGGLYTEVVKNDARNFGFTGYGFTNGFRNEAGITPGSAAAANYIPLVTGGGFQNGLMSLFFTANYGYDNKYFLNLVGRRDGSSKFGTANRWGNFGSIGAAWNISEEDFMKKITFVNNLKLRASYGSTGNNATPNYPLDQFGAVTYAGVGGFSPNVAGNPLITWETNVTTNIGLDFSVLKNRLSGTIEVYNRKTKDLFYDVPVDPAAGGFVKIPSNFGSLRNRGIELSLNGDVFSSTTGVSWNLGANISYNKNEILSLPTDNVIDGVTRLSVGKPINSLFLVPYAGVNPDNGHALYRKLDGSITDLFDTADKIMYGTSDAPWFGGFSTRVSYKGFDLSAQLNFFLKRQMFNNDLTNITNPDYYFDNLHVSMLNEWTPNNRITDVPSSDPSGNNTFQTETSRFLENANFWRLRNVTLGYNIPKSALNKIKVRSARIFIQGQNLWTSTKFRGFDPEATGSSLTGAQYPSLVQGSIGLSIGF